MDVNNAPKLLCVLSFSVGVPGEPGQKGNSLVFKKINYIIKRVVIETTGVCVNNVARGVMALCCDVMLCYVTTYTSIGLFFQNALVDHIGVCTDTNKVVQNWPLNWSSKHRY